MVTGASMIVALLAMSAMPATAALKAPKAARQPEPPRISLKATVVLPGGELRVPIYLERRGRDIASVAFGLKFPARHLTFVKLELASRKLRPVATRASSRVSDDDQDLLEISLSHETEPLPEGPLGWLTFRLDAKTAVKELPLELVRVVGHNVAGRLLEKIAAEGARVVIMNQEEAEAIAACFFYMH